jgi:hypothetical protein
LVSGSWQRRCTLPPRKPRNDAHTIETERDQEDEEMTTRTIRTILSASVIGAAASFALLGQPDFVAAAPQEAPRSIADERVVQAPRTPDQQEAPRTPDQQEAPRTPDQQEAPRGGSTCHGEG